MTDETKPGAGEDERVIALTPVQLVVVVAVVVVLIVLFRARRAD